MNDPVRARLGPIVYKCITKPQKTQLPAFSIGIFADGAFGEGGGRAAAHSWFLAAVIASGGYFSMSRVSLTYPWFEDVGITPRVSAPSVARQAPPCSVVPEPP